MMGDMWWIALGTFMVSLSIQYIVIKISHKYSFFMDLHTDEKPQNFHTDTTPRAGGVGIIISMFFLLFTVLGWKMLLSLILAFLSGIFEDFHHSIKPKIRLILQFIAALSSVVLTDSVVTYLGFDFTLSYAIGVALSIFAIIGMMNAINIIDGFNGLASSIVTLILLSFGIVAYQVGDSEILDIITIAISSIFAFFLFNFPKGKIFLGDGGAYLLGFIVATIGISLAGHYEKVSPWYVLAIFIYPVWEVFFSIMRKFSIGLSPMQPDRYHLHMLVYRQLTQSNPLTALFMTGVTLPFMTLSTIFPERSTSNIAIALTFIISYSLLYYTLYKKDTKNSQ